MEQSCYTPGDPSRVVTLSWTQAKLYLFPGPKQSYNTSLEQNRAVTILLGKLSPSCNTSLDLSRAVTLSLGETLPFCSRVLPLALGETFPWRSIISCYTYGDFVVFLGFWLTGSLSIWTVMLTVTALSFLSPFTDELFGNAERDKKREEKKEEGKKGKYVES